MMKIQLYQVDAFTNVLFGGNPAAICPLDYWLDNHLMQKIASENNLSETAFFVTQDNRYEIRWFTPKTEVDLCGHATLAAAFVIFYYLNINIDKVIFSSKSGELIVTKNNSHIILNFPIISTESYEVDDLISQIVQVKPVAVFKGADIMIVLNTEDQVRQFIPDYRLIEKLNSRGLVITAPGCEVDFVSRWFGPQVGVNEDPVTGSAHCMLAPYWASRLNKTNLYAEQLSARLGKIYCEVKNNRVLLAGQAVLYLKGEIEIQHESM